MNTREAEYARLLKMAAEEDALADEAKGRNDDILLIDQHRRRAAYFRQKAILFLHED